MLVGCMQTVEQAVFDSTVLAGCRACRLVEFVRVDYTGYGY